MWGILGILWGILALFGIGVFIALFMGAGLGSSEHSRNQIPHDSRGNYEKGRWNTRC